MASPPSPEASEVRRRGRRRLIGAVAIVLLLIVFVPMILDSEPRPTRREPEMQIPPRDKAPPLPPPVAAEKAPPVLATVAPKSAELMRGGPPEAPKAPAPSPKAEAEKPQASVTPPKSEAEKPPAPKAEAEKPKVAPPLPKAEAEKPKAPALAPKAEAEKPAAAPKLEGFAIQVGAFRDEDKLQQAREKLVAAGVVHYTERLENPAGPLTRLRAGPFPTRAAADAALVKIKPAAPDGKVVPLP